MTEIKETLKQFGNTIVLRKRLPFYCMAKDLVSGKQIHLDHPLTEDDGDVCAAHAKAKADAEEKFFNRPIEYVAPVVESMDDMMKRRQGRPPLWP